MILKTFYYHLLLWNFALNGLPEAADDPHLHPGVAGSHDVLGGRKGVQNDPYNFLLPPDFIKLCSKWLP